MTNFSPGIDAKSADGSSANAYWRLFIPKLAVAIGEGYSWSKLGSDAAAGATVAILALPLSMAIAIGCGVAPDKGLVTSVIAGFLISALGGSRFQIGGPAAAFIVVIAAVIDKHGFDGLVTATFLAGVVLVIAGFLKLGTYIRYIPGPVILGFTCGIGILIGVGQLKDYLGLNGEVPADIIGKLAGLWAIRDTWEYSALAAGTATLMGISVCRMISPRLPGLLIAVVGVSAVAWLAGLPVQTIGTRFGGIASAFPAPAFPNIQAANIVALMPTVFTLAFLVGVESLISAVAADTMAGTRHRSNVEIVAQGVANMASALFGGLPATGVIARTGTNIAAGARTPVAGLLHAMFVLAFMLLLAPLASYLALPCLAAVLLNTAWRLIEPKEVWRFLTRAPPDDRIILLATLLLTVFVDLSVAIAVGVVLACMLFMHRMAEMKAFDLGGQSPIVEDTDDLTRPPGVIQPADIPDGIKVFQFRGPLFFGAAAHVNEALAGLKAYPRVIILRLREVPLVDSTAVAALDDLGRACALQGCRLVISGLQRQPREALHRLGFLRENHVILASNIFMAVEKAKALLEADKSA